MARNVKKSTHWLTVSFLICLCYFIDIKTTSWLPNVSSNIYDFSVATTRQYLQHLVNFGPRVAGTDVNDIDTVQYLIDKLQQIKNNAPSSVLVEVDEQHPSGTFHTKFLNGITHLYKNVSNVIVRISWPEVEAQYDHSLDIVNQAILVNAHFDTVAGSPGASDDGLGVAIMLEVTRSIVNGKALKKPIIMLFNGAEESIHHAAHGFITKHKWSKSIKYVINLESLGAGGREMVFQCNSAEMMKLYGKVVPYPHAQVSAHELFKHVLWRAASSDWSTFLKYGTPGEMLC